MALTKYVSQTPNTVSKPFVAAEFRKVQLTTDSIIEILQALGVPIQLGAPDSGGLGFRILRVPN